MPPPWLRVDPLPPFISCWWCWHGCRTDGVAWPMITPPMTPLIRLNRGTSIWFWAHQAPRGSLWEHWIKMWSLHTKTRCISKNNICFKSNLVVSDVSTFFINRRWLEKKKTKLSPRLSDFSDWNRWSPSPSPPEENMEENTFASPPWRPNGSGGCAEVSRHVKEGEWSLEMKWGSCFHWRVVLVYCGQGRFSGGDGSMWLFVCILWGSSELREWFNLFFF